MRYNEAGKDLSFEACFAGEETQILMLLVFLQLFHLQAFQRLALGVADAASKGAFRVWLSSRIDLPSILVRYTSV